MNAKIAPFTKASFDTRFRPDSQREKNIRVYVVPFIACCVLLTGFLRLFQLTIVKGSYYRFIAENNRLREDTIDGSRGRIFDRKGMLLADSQKTDSANDTYMRVYYGATSVGHTLGYRQIASPELVAADACQQPITAQDRVGVKGVEGYFECHLRPRKGLKLVETDAQGKALKVLSHVDPRAGNDIKLSIDSELHRKALEIITNNAISTTTEVNLPEKHIAITAMDPRSGELLMLFSYPSFDPQDFENGSSRVKEYLLSKDKPLFNRALLGTYPPGSVFKPIVALGALEEKAIHEDDTIHDSGFIKAGPATFNNWYYTQYGKTDGDVNLRTALQRSNDIYFYTIGEKLTPEHIMKWSATFGLGQKTGIPLEDAPGTIPSAFWKSETVGERWYLGDTYNLSIGQGYLLVTPLQITRALAAFANDGKLCTPLILKAQASESKLLPEYATPSCTNLHLSAKHVQAVREGMKMACETKGTGWPFFDFSITPEDSTASDSARRLEVGCKTGTAESQTTDHEPHSWFTVFAPYDNPEIIMTVLVENGGEGSAVAAPIAKELLKTYFARTE